MRLYQYRAEVVRIVDGDTVHLLLDWGGRNYYKGSCRLTGINAPELSTGEPGAKARDWLITRLVGKRVWIRSTGLDKYGRLEVTIYEPEPAHDSPVWQDSVNAEMLTEGLAAGVPT